MITDAMNGREINNNRDLTVAKSESVLIVRVSVKGWSRDGVNRNKLTALI